jgi:RNA polymerase sigma factor (sigma-70 family)
MRRMKRRRRALEVEAPLALLADEDHPAAPRTDVDSALAARQGLVSALSKLAPKQRLALALRYVHDLSDAEIAAALGCRAGTVHALLSRGRKSLRADTQLLELALELKGG